MPLIHVDLVEGRLDATRKAALADALIKGVLEAEHLPDNPQARMVAWVIFNERPKDSFVGVEGQDARYLVRLSAPRGLMDEAGKTLVITRVTEAVQAAEGPGVFLAGFGPWIIIEEVPDGSWGAGGRPLKV